MPKHLARTRPGPYRFLSAMPDLDRPAKDVAKAMAPSGVAATSGTVVLRLYDIIDSWGSWWGTSAREFAEVLDSLGDDVTNIRLHINSPGGEAHEGIAIHNLLRQHPAEVTTVVDGLAASAATMVALAGDTVVMSPHTEFMIHDAWQIVMGDATYLRKIAGQLDKLSDSYAGAYAEKGGGTVEAWRAAMLEESWYTAEETVAAGLADRVGLEEDPAGRAVEPPIEEDDDLDELDPLARFDTRFFAHADRASSIPSPARSRATTRPPAAPAAGSTTPAASALGDPTQEGQTAVDITDEQLNTLRQAAGVPEDADLETTIAGVQEALQEQADPPEQNASQTTVPAGMVLVDEATFAELRSGATAGQEAHTRQQREDRQALVNAAVRDGRIPPARTEHWLTQLEQDPGAAATLAALAPGLIPVEARGHADHDDPSAGGDAYDSIYGKKGA